MVEHLSKQQAVLLASELNHLLWTDDPAPIPHDVAHHDFDVPPINMQCVSHSLVCAILLARRGAHVTTRAGSAWVVEQNQRQPFHVLKHWWMTTESGLVDFSLHLSGFSERDPVVYNNEDVGEYWPIIFCDDLQGIKRRMQRAYEAGGRGIFYQADKKMNVTRSELEAEMPKLFSPSEPVSPFPYGAIVLHCERLLNGGPSFKSISQHEAWQGLSHSF